MTSRRHGSRAFRGLTLVFILTFVNLVGLLLTVGSLGLLEGWSRSQFVGLFGVIETAAGLSNILAPNIWHLPAAEQKTSERTEIKLAASAMLIPHWGGAARAGAGACLMVVAGFGEGWSVSSALFLPFLASLFVILLGVSALIARVGVAWAEVDTIQFVVRWRGRESELAPLSLSASVQQFILGVLTFPAVQLLNAGALFQPAFAPSTQLSMIAVALGLVSVLATALVWSNRIQWRAPREQQQEAESNA